MLVWIFISSGLFLGWKLGAYDAANIFGTTAETRMIKFRTAAIIASIFIVLGAVLQGYGAADTLTRLGAIDAMGGAFTVAFCSAVVVMVMTKNKLSASVSQAIVGAIIGWCYFTSKSVEYSVVSTIIGSWISAPIIGALFSALLFLMLRKFLLHTKIHLIKQEAISRIALIFSGAFAAYSFGANNIANVMGVFINAVSFTITFGSVTFQSTQVLFFLGSLAIALGIFTYGKKAMENISREWINLSPESAIVVILSQAVVLFLFSSSTLSTVLISVGLPSIPLVPVSSTHVLAGSIFGIGMVKGMQEVKLKMLGNLLVGWILTPLSSGVLTFFSLFFVSTVFGIAITNQAPIANNSLSLHATNTLVNIPIAFTPLTTIFFLFIVILLSIGVFFIYKKNNARLQENKKRWAEQLQFSEFQKALTEIEINAIHIENDTLAARLEERKKELITYSLNIGQQRELLNSICKSIEKALNETNNEERNLVLTNELIRIKQKMSFNSEAERIYQEAEQSHNEFLSRLVSRFPNLTNQEKRLLVLLRIGLSTKEIAPVLNISTKSVENGRHRLRKKLNLKKEENLTQFVKII